MVCKAGPLHLVRQLEASAMQTTKRSVNTTACLASNPSSY